MSQALRRWRSPRVGLFVLVAMVTGLSEVPGLKSVGHSQTVPELDGSVYCRGATVQAATSQPPGSRLDLVGPRLQPEACLSFQSSSDEASDSIRVTLRSVSAGFGNSKSYQIEVTGNQIALINPATEANVANLTYDGPNDQLSGRIDGSWYTWRKFTPPNSPIVGQKFCWYYDTNDGLEGSNCRRFEPKQVGYEESEAGSLNVLEAFTYQNSGNTVFIYSQHREQGRQVALAKLTGDGLVLRNLTAKQNAILVKKDHRGDELSGLAFCQSFDNQTNPAETTTCLVFGADGNGQKETMATSGKVSTPFNYKIDGSEVTLQTVSTSSRSTKQKTVYSYEDQSKLVLTEQNQNRNQGQNQGRSEFQGLETLLLSKGLGPDLMGQTFCRPSSNANSRKPGGCLLFGPYGLGMEKTYQGGGGEQVEKFSYKVVDDVIELVLTDPSGVFPNAYSLRLARDGQSVDSVGSRRTNVRWYRSGGKS